MVAITLKRRFGSANSYTAVVPYMLLGVGKAVEERGLATIGISYQGNADHTSFLLGGGFQLLHVDGTFVPVRMQ